jgi:hypothetical protein
LPEQFVAEPDRSALDDQQSALDAALHCHRLRSEGLLQQPQLGPGRDHGHQPHDLLGVRRQAGKAGEHQVPDSGGHAGLARCEHLGDQQRVPAGQGADPSSGAAGPTGQLRHGALRQRLQRQAAHRLAGQAGEDHEERMAGCQLVVAIGDGQHRRGALQSPPQQHQQVQGGLVGPMGVFHHHHLRPRRLVQLVLQRGEQLLPRASCRQQCSQPAARLASDVVQRPQGSGGEQRVAGPEQEPGSRRVPLGESLDQCRLADAGLARHKHDAATRRSGQHAIQRRIEPTQLGFPANKRHGRGGHGAKLWRWTEVGMHQHKDVLRSRQPFR